MTSRSRIWRRRRARRARSPTARPPRGSLPFRLAAGRTISTRSPSRRSRRFAREAARQAVLKLRAVDAPAGTMTVVLGPGWPGILLHEAVGHGLEGDFNRKGTSAFAGRMGQKVASELVTVIDDGTIPNRRGSLNVDDEGTPTGRTVLIEKGILVGYMQDRLNARLMGMAATGNGRRESYAYAPMPRMTNTFMPAGEDDPEDIIKSVRRGLYAVSFGGGQRSEEHTSELQSLAYLVCRLLLEKKKKGPHHRRPCHSRRPQSSCDRSHRP